MTYWFSDAANRWLLADHNGDLIGQYDMAACITNEYPDAVYAREQCALGHVWNVA